MRRFYNPDLTTEEADRLDWQNYVTLQAVQALLGLISKDMEAVFVEVQESDVVLHFVVPAERESDCIEDIEDAAFELDVLLEGRTLIRTEVHPSRPPEALREWSGVYSRRRR